MHRRLELRTLSRFLAPTLLALSLGACADAGTSQIPCTTSLDCPKLQVCMDGQCGVLACDSTQAFSADCGANGVCAAGDLCTPVECQCLGCSECAEGLTCVLGLCVAGGPGDCAGVTCTGKKCTEDKHCDTLKCKGGTCQSAEWCAQDADCETKKCDVATSTCTTGGSEDPDTSTGACTADSCGEGQVCNEDTGECEETGGGGGGQQLCRACPGGEKDCGGPETATCVAFAASAYCLTECVTNNECPSGYQCFNLPDVGSRCIPGSGTCDKKCIQEGCAEGKVCEFSTGLCVAPLGVCDSCSTDDTCGPGNRCVKFGPNNKKCVPQCAADDQCPQNSSCTTEEGVKVCKPTGAACCFGPTCGSDACGGTCAAPTPNCWQGTCVECLNDGHCGAGQKCDTATHKCKEEVGPQNCNQCSGATPVCHPQLNKCVACLNSTHCGSGQICDPNTNSCTGDICAACGGDYPHCAEINGDKSCVQCSDDSHCQSGTCKNYWCEGGGGGTGPSTGNCQTAGCPTSAQFVLACDQATGLCYDTTGACDNITAFCDAASGSTCQNLLGGGGGAGLPPELLPGAFGLCTCRPPLADLGCLLDPAGAVCLSKGNCLGGIECGGLSAMCGFGF